MLHYFLDPNVIARHRNTEGATRGVHHPKASLLPAKLGLQEIDEYIDRNEAHLPAIARLWLNGRPFDIEANARANRTGNRHAVKNALRAGATLELGGLESGHLVVSAICAALEGLFGGRASSKIVVVPQGRQPMAPRFDAGSSFIVQLHGTVPWMSCGRCANHPLPEMARTLGADEIDARATLPLTLRPGDVLFVPAGVGYGTPGVAAEPAVFVVFNVSPVAPIDLLRRAFEGLAPSIESLRAPLHPAAPDFQSRMDAAVADLFGVLIAQSLQERLLNFNNAQVRSVGCDISMASVLGANERRTLTAQRSSGLAMELVTRGLAGAPSASVAGTAASLN